MATTDKSEWILLDTDLTTRLAILPVASGHLYFEMNEPGSGEIKIPLDSSAASLVEDSMYCQLSYRGSVRGGFLIENIKKTQADTAEGGGRWLSLSGRGGLAILEEAIVWDTGGTEAMRQFTSVTKASALITLITEAKARGGLANLTYDFSAVNDSSAVAWTDSDAYSFAFENSLLDVVRTFVATGSFNVSINISGGNIVLSAYQAAIGTNKATTVFMRIGSNCEEVVLDARGNEVRNVIRTNYRDGFTTSTDSTSVTNHRRREKFVSASDIPTATLSAVVGAAELSQYKDPQTSITLRVYDGVKPYLFEDYSNGDTVTIDAKGTQTSYRILGVQADFEGDQFTHVVLETNTLFRERDIQTQQQLDRLAALLAQQKDATTLNISQWFGLGLPDDGYGLVYCMEHDSVNDTLYLGGDFTQLAGVTATNIIKYDLNTRVFSAIGSTFDDRVLALKIVSGVLFVGGEFTSPYEAICKYTIATGVWSALSGGTRSGPVYALDNSGNTLYVGGQFNNWNGEATADSITSYSISGDTWASIGGQMTGFGVYVLKVVSGTLYAGGNFINAGGIAGANYIGQYAGGAWSAVGGLSKLNNLVRSMCNVGDYLYIGGKFTNAAGDATADKIVRYQISSGTWLSLGGNIVGSQSMDAIVYDSLHNFLYVGGYINVNGLATANWFGQYDISGNEWSSLTPGFDSEVYTLYYDTIRDELYAGGDFTTVNDMTNRQVLAVYIRSIKNALAFAAGYAVAAHSPVSLDSNADTILSITDNQVMGLDTQTANRVFAGPTGGGAAVPAFRALVSGDIPALSYGDIFGTGVVGQVAEFVTNTKTIQAAKLIAPAANILTLTNVAAATLALNITAGKTLTLTTTDNFALTVPATGTAVLHTYANSGNLGMGVTPTARLHIKGTNSTAEATGSNLLTADGTFATSAGWTVGAGWTIGGGVVTHATGNTATLAGTSTATSTTMVYKIEFTVAVTTAGTGFTVTLGGVTHGTTFSSAGTKVIFIRPTSTTGTLTVTPGSGGTFVGTIDDVSIYAMSPSDPDAIIENDSTGSEPMEFRTGDEGQRNFFFGHQAGRYSNNLGGGSTGKYNIFAGNFTGKYNADGSYNSAFGTYALSNIVSGFSNAAFGYEAGLNLSTGYQNTCFAYAAGYSLTSGLRNVLIGVQAGRNLVSSQDNVMIGVFAGYTNTGNYNTAIGYYVLGNATAALSSQTVIGYQAGYNNTGGGVVLLGYQAGVNNTVANALYIANSSTATPLIYGIFSGTSAGVTIHGQNTAGIPLTVKGIASQTADLQQWVTSAGAVLLNVQIDGDLEFHANNIITDTTTGTKIGTGTTQKLGLWNATPIVQPTTAIAAATFVANTSNIVNDSATFDGYTIGQIVKALRNIGALA